MCISVVKWRWKNKIVGRRTGKFQRDYLACTNGAFNDGKIETLITLVGKHGISLQTAMHDVWLDKKYKDDTIRELKNRGMKYVE